MLTDFMPDCSGDTLNIAGVEVDVYFTCADEIATDPKSKSEMPGALKVNGDTNRIGENYSFAGAKVGEGFFRKMRVISDTGEIATNGTVKDGTTKIDNDFKFKLKGFGPVEKEFAERVSACCGLVLLVTDKSGVTHEFGRRRNPAMIKSFKGGTGGDFRGFEYELMANGRTPRTFDLASFTPDTTPN
jgi:hypothetical protein